MMPARRHLSLFLAVLALRGLGACTPPPDESQCWDSSNEPGATSNSTIAIDGRVLHQDGTPVPGHVLLEEPPTLADLFSAVVTLGLSCLSDDLSSVDCSDYQRLTLDAEGRFDLTMPEQDTSGSLGFDRTFVLFAGLPTSTDGMARPSFVAWARFRRQHVALPDFRLWEPALALVPGEGQLVVQLEQPTRRACTSPQEMQIEFVDAQGQLVWSQPPDRVDTRVLEDMHGTARVHARFSNDALDRQVDSFALYSGAVAFAGSAGAPASRGTACVLAGQTHTSDCPLSDGAVELITEATGSAQLDLGTIRTLELVVLRGLFQSVTLSASVDGQAWTPIASGLAGSFVSVAPAQTLQARHLRLQEGRDAQGQQPALVVGELSAW